MLKENDRRVLYAVIDAYVRDGVPVSSQRLRDAGGFRVSTATIRNRMVALERDGYLSKMHASSGRVPTDRGYRVYVDELQSDDRAWNEFADRCREELRGEVPDVNAVMANASHLIGELSKNLAVVYGAIVRESHVRTIKLVRLDGPRMLVVVNFEPEFERTTVLRFKKVFSTDVVANSERLINAVVAGKPVEAAKEELDAGVRDNVTDEGIIMREVAIHREAVFSEPPAVDFYFEERGHLLDQPELADPRNLQLILRLVHDKDYLTAILSRRSQDRTEVTIGSENGDEALHGFSVVTSGYRMGAARGVLGIIGPTRMRYDIALSVVGGMSRELRAIGEELF